MSETTEPSSGPAPKDNRHLKTVIFVVALVGVVGVFQALNAFADPPPDMPADTPHTLILNTENLLVGVGDPATWPTTDANGKPYPLEKKAIERRVNLSCTACHGAPPGLRDEEFASKVTCAVPNKCVATHEKHPQKSTCIKCHRMPPGGAAAVK